MNDYDFSLGQKIKKLRKKIAFSQDLLAEQLGIKRVALSQIENGQRKLTPQEITKFSNFFNLSSDVFLDIKKDIEVVYQPNEDKKVLSMNTENLRISVPVENISKFKEVLLYILAQVGAKPNVGETVIYKLLYFMDFDFYEKYEEHFIGARYQKNHYGPTPMEFKIIIEEMDEKDLIKIENRHYQYPQRKYLPLRSPDLSQFKASELEVMEHVLQKHADKNAKQISDYSHNDIPWLTTDDGEIIDYESVFYRTTPYSVRSYGEEDF